MRTPCKIALAVGLAAPAVNCFAIETQLIGSGFTWVSDSAWQPIAGINDALGGTTGKLDFVGDSSNWGGYFAKDANYVYVRMRVATPTVTASTYSDTLMVLINSPAIAPANVNFPVDYGFVWDTNGGSAANHGLEMSVPASNGAFWQNNRMDDLDGLSGQKGTNDINGGGRTTDGYVRAVDGQSTANLGTTSFIDFAVSLNYLDTYTNLKKASGTNWSIQFASIANANDHNTISADVAGGASLTSVATQNWTKSVTAAKIALSNPLTSSRVIRGGTGTAGVTVDNTAPSGYDSLVYTATAAGTGVSLGSATPAAGSLSPDGAPVAHTFTVGTSAATAFGSNSITITVADPNSFNASQAATSTVTVLDHSNAEFANVSGAATATSGSNSLTLNFGTVRQGSGGGVLDAAFAIAALQSQLTTLAYTAGLDLDSVGTGTGDVAKLYRASGPTSFNSMAAGSQSQPYTFALSTTQVGSYSATYTFSLSDENIAGASAPGSEVLTLTLLGNVVAVPEAGSVAMLSMAGMPLLLARRRMHR